MRMRYQPTVAEDDILDLYTVNLTKQASEGKLDPVIGRNEEIRWVMQILARRTKNNPVLLGDPGVGKTAIVEGLAQRITSGDVPATLKHREVLVLDLASLIAGSAFRGEFEDRIKKLLKKIEAGGKYILFMDELHIIIGAGGAEGAVDAANILKPALARGSLRAIGATTVREYRRYIEKDAALERRFQPVYVDEPSLEDTIAILRGIKERYELHHGVRITDDALNSAATLSYRYITDRYLPDKAIDLIDEAASALKIEVESMPLTIDQLVRKITQREIELAALRKEKDDNMATRRQELEDEIKKLKLKESKLRKRWDKQKEIIGELQKSRTELDQLRIALEKAEREVQLEKAAEIKYGKIPEVEKRLEKLEQQWQSIPEEKRLIKEEVTEEDIAAVVARWTNIPVAKLLSSEAEKLLNLEEELEKRVVGQEEPLKKIAAAIRRNRVGIGEPTKPIGSFLFLGPTGVGKTETAKALADYLFNDERAMVRIDMSEYQEAHSVARLIGAPPGYVGYEEGGQLTENIRRKPYCVVLFDEIEKAHSQIFNVFLQVFDEGRLTDGRGRTVNFKNTVMIMTSNLGGDIIRSYVGKDQEKMRLEVMNLVQKSFRPEFLNRLDTIIIYKNLSPSLMSQIVNLQLDLVDKRLQEKQIAVYFSPQLVKYLSEIGFDPVYGARPLKRHIQELVLDELALQMLEGKIKKHHKLTVDVENGKVTFKIKRD